MTRRMEIDRLREAFIRGARHVRVLYGASLSVSAVRVDAAKAAETYPMPTETRPRVVEVLGDRYRFVDGRLEFECPGYGWMRSPNSVESFGHGIALIADLVLNPTETVEVSE